MSKGAKKWVLMFWKSTSSNSSTVLKELKKEHRGNKGAIKKFLVLANILESEGPSLPLPYNKYLLDDIFELRDVGNGKRYYYKETDFYIVNEDEESQIILLMSACGNKGSQQSDINNATERTKGGITIKNILNEERLKITKKG